MTSLTTSIKHFASINRATGSTWTEAIKRKAPHKPPQLPAVLDLVHGNHQQQLSRLLTLAKFTF